MGYTHYINNVENIDPPTWSIICEHVKAIIAATDIPLAFEHDDVDTLPEVSEDAIHFNGIGDDGHETFYFTPTCSNEFIKTELKPYDTVVVACLYAISFYIESAVFTSDGEIENLENGITLFYETKPSNLRKAGK